MSLKENISNLKYKDKLQSEFSTEELETIKINNSIEAKSAFRFGNSNNHNIHVPVYIQNPKRLIQKGKTPTGYALSCYTTIEALNNARLGLNDNFISKNPDTFFLAINRDSGKITFENTQKHFDLFENADFEPDNHFHKIEGDNYGNS